MSPQQLFARQAFALALGSLDIEVEPEAVVTLIRSSDNIRCVVMDPTCPMDSLADGSFQGDEEGGEVKIVLVNEQRLEQARSFWFMAHIDGTPIAIEDVTARFQSLTLIEEEELAEAL